MHYDFSSMPYSIILFLFVLFFEKFRSAPYCFGIYFASCFVKKNHRRQPSCQQSSLDVWIILKLASKGRTFWFFYAKSLMSQASVLKEFTYKLDFTAQSHFKKTFKKFIDISASAFQIQLLIFTKIVQAFKMASNYFCTII